MASPTLLERLWLVPFSTFVWLGGFVIMIVTSLVSLLLWPVLPPRAQSAWSAKAFAQVLRVTFCRVEITYDPAFDPKRPSLYCQNHVSVLDAFVACRAIPSPFVGMMLAWHFKVPGYGWMMKATNGIPVHPPSRAALKQLGEDAEDRAKKGLSILVFPEAHRTVDGTVREFQKGVFSMAKRAELPVVALAVRGLYAVNRKGSALIRPGKIQIYVGPQIETAGLSAPKLSAVIDRLHASMSDFVEGRDDAASGIRGLKGLNAGPAAQVA